MSHSDPYYPALTRLEKAGAVVATVGSAAETGDQGASTSSSTAAGTVHRPPVPSAASSTSCAPAGTPRPGAAGARRVWITDAGHQLFTDLLAGGTTSDDARSFDLRLAFARHLAPQARLALLEHQPRPAGGAPGRVPSPTAARTTSTSTPAPSSSTRPTVSPVTSVGWTP